MQAKRTRAELEKRRLQAMTLAGQGHSSAHVAGKLGVDRRSVDRWRAAYRRHGLAGLQAKRAAGRPVKLSAADIGRLREILSAGARSSGYPGDQWTGPRIAEIIARRFEVRYHPAHIGRLLRKIGLV